jgi:hypothetical protein
MGVISTVKKMTSNNNNDEIPAEAWAQVLEKSGERTSRPYTPSSCMPTAE